MSFSTRQATHSRSTWNRIVLLHGPSGTGKSSLSRALAQQLSIRLKSQYPCTKLVEIDAHSLFSRYFGESGKLVGKIFGAINVMLDAEQDTFFCIFIDEVESLASARQQSTNNNEPRDSLRVCFFSCPPKSIRSSILMIQAVNALLIGLDRLRHRPNVLVLCTSNLIEAMVIDRFFVRFKSNSKPRT